MGGAAAPLGRSAAEASLDKLAAQKRQLHQPRLHGHPDEPAPEMAGQTKQFEAETPLGRMAPLMSWSGRPSFCRAKRHPSARALT